MGKVAVGELSNSAVYIYSSITVTVRVWSILAMHALFLFLG